MSDPAFLDANSFKLFVDCQLRGGSGEPSSCFKHLCTYRYIALDDQGFFLQEWKDCTGGFVSEFVETIIGNLMQANEIRLHAVKINSHVNKKFRQLGVPNRDAKAIAFSIAVPVKNIVSNDVDFYDPKKNKVGEAERLKELTNRTGPVCREIQKEHGIMICTLEAVPTEIS